MTELLLELYSEEIPARMQQKASADLKRLVCDALVDAGLTYASAGAFSTPRRLTLVLDQISNQSQPKRQERRGPRVDAPQKALDGFLQSTGLQKDQLEIREDKKGATYYATIEHPGQSATDIIAQCLPDILHNFPWPKSMRWGDSSLRWVRPLHSILCILSSEDGADTVDLNLDGLCASNQTFGHLFHAPDAITVHSFDDYQQKLAAAYVILSHDDRRDKIINDAQNLAFANGLELVEDTALLNEVAGLVEWPVVLIGQIDKRFLDLPAEVLQTSMRSHQKFFSLKNPKTGQIEQFITVANRETEDQGAMILAGNQKVLGARLADGEFFWQNDLRIAKANIKDWELQLNNVSFHNKLGSQSARIDRVADLAKDLAQNIGADGTLAARAARLAKLDLASQMVNEFPELQGVMGRYYALAAGEYASIAAVAEQHYAPLGPNDAVPDAPLSVAVALADKIDTLCAFWAIDEKPTGSKDPFALRRAALGVIRLVLENNLRLNLTAVFEKHNQDTDAVDLMRFFHDRMKVYLRDQALRHDVIDACLTAPNSDDFTNLVARSTALQGFLGTDDGENLLQGFKRANNILRAEEAKDGVSYELPPDIKLAQDGAENTLFGALENAKAAIDAALLDEDYNATMQSLAQLRAPIDGFFDAVQVNSDKPILRRNRLCLLNEICTITAKIGAFDRLVG